MKLVDLSPQFVHAEDGGKRLRKVETLREANGVLFLCPKCFTANQGSKGTHSVLCYTPEVPLEFGQGPGRWPMTGVDYLDLSLTPSVQLLGGCNWHGFITHGEVSSV